MIYFAQEILNLLTLVQYMLTPTAEMSKCLSELFRTVKHTTHLIELTTFLNELLLHSDSRERSDVP